MAKRKPIKLRAGCQKLLAERLGVSRLTVSKALKWDNDTNVQNLVRDKAVEFGYVKRF